VSSAGVFDWAVFGGDLTTLETTAELLPPSELHAANRFGCTAIHWAASGGSMAVLRWLYLLRPSLLLKNFSGSAEKRSFSRFYSNV
jgi:hypothetical protein